METVDRMNPEVARLFTAKQERRRQLAALPFPNKVRLVVQLQRMAAPILRTRGRDVRVWNLDAAEPTLVRLRPGGSGRQ